MGNSLSDSLFGMCMHDEQYRALHDPEFKFPLVLKTPKDQGGEEIKFLTLDVVHIPTLHARYSL